jgi:RNA polymerase sigma factor (sigma-70 family)
MLDVTHSIHPLDPEATRRFPQPMPEPSPLTPPLPALGSGHASGADGDTDAERRLAALLDRVAAQEAAALKSLYDSTAARMHGLALRIVRNAEWAEDVLQEAYLQIWRTAGSYRAALSPPLAWMGLIVRSRALDHLRRMAAQRSQQTESLDDDHGADLDGGGPTPLDTAQASEQAWALHQCLSRLENKQREVVSLAYLRDLSHGELSDRLKLPLGTVKTWIRRGLDQLRVCMARYA